MKLIVDRIITTHPYALPRPPIKGGQRQRRVFSAPPGAGGRTDLVLSMLIAGSMFVKRTVFVIGWVADWFLVLKEKGKKIKNRVMHGAQSAPCIRF